MSPIDLSVLARKLGTIQERLDLLRAVAALSLDEYLSDVLRKKGAEKLLQELVNATVDANYHILMESGKPPPADAYGSFLDLASLGTLDGALARELAPFAGLRNRLVHEYATLDDEKVLASLGEAESLFPRYIRAVRRRFLPPAP
ncbi:MAG: DUF86 domain-containing protein [Planctomycetes bacterium]|nr:DUF86 domain-containing protein [Planctomycetota bacterium]